MKVSVFSRKTHRWVSLAVALPAGVILCTGILLQLKKEFRWIQPPEQQGNSTTPVISFEQILRACQSVPEAQVASWNDVNRIDVRVSKGMMKVWCMNNWEVQLDSATGDVLQVAYRRSDMIEAIHDGSWFHANAKYGLFLPAGICLLMLWMTGMYLFAFPYWVKWRRPERRALKSRAASPGSQAT
jgi:uncharacterized iron-regulated membrane protein